MTKRRTDEGLEVNPAPQQPPVKRGQEVTPPPVQPKKKQRKK
jgi:hypothetical protein